MIRWDLADRAPPHRLGPPLTAHTVVERACSATHGGLDRDEWARYVQGLPYQDSCPA